MGRENGDKWFGFRDLFVKFGKILFLGNGFFPVLFGKGTFKGSDKVVDQASSLTHKRIEDRYNRLIYWSIKQIIQRSKRCV